APGAPGPAPGETRRICDALDDLRRQAGRPKWVDVELTEELEAAHGEAIRSAIAEHGLREANTVVEELIASTSPAIGMSSTEEDMVCRTQVRASFASSFEKARMAAVDGPVRGQFE